MNYRIYTSDSSIDLEALVQEKLNNGWECQGGVSVFRYEWENERKGYSESSWVWSQAMIHDGEAP